MIISSPIYLAFAYPKIGNTSNSKFTRSLWQIMHFFDHNRFQIAILIWMLDVTTPLPPPPFPPSYYAQLRRRHGKLCFCAFLLTKVYCGLVGCFLNVLNAVKKSEMMEDILMGLFFSGVPWKENKTTQKNKLNLASFCLGEGRGRRVLSEKGEEGFDQVAAKRGLIIVWKKKLTLLGNGRRDVNCLISGDYAGSQFLGIHNFPKIRSQRMRTGITLPFSHHCHSFTHCLRFWCNFFHCIFPFHHSSL